MLFSFKIILQYTSTSPLIKLTLITSRNAKNRTLQQRDGIPNVFALAFICHWVFFFSGVVRVCASLDLQRYLRLEITFAEWVRRYFFRRTSERDSPVLFIISLSFMHGRFIRSHNYGRSTLLSCWCVPGHCETYDLDSSLDVCSVVCIFIICNNNNNFAISIWNDMDYVNKNLLR